MRGSILRLMEMNSRYPEGGQRRGIGDWQTLEEMSGADREPSAEHSRSSR
jgi:hypothetical protein